MDQQFGNGPFGNARTFWAGGPRWSGSYDPSIRVSDAERTQMSETLSKHYAEGRLDDAEFRARLDKAMSAKTRGDLSGLLGDLPPLHSEQQVRRRPGIIKRAWWGFTVLAMVVLGFWVISAITTPHIPWVLVLIVLAIVWHRGRRHFRHHHHDHYPANY